MKYCPVCKQEKELKYFHNNKARYDGKASRCNNCKSLEKKLYKQKYKEKIALQRCEYEKRDGVQKKRYAKLKIRKEQNINLKLSLLLRGRFSKAVKGNFKAGSAVKDLGCSIQELKEYLEKQFKNGMSWDNHGIGKGKWNIDHIYPISKVDLTDRDQLLKVCNYTNLQPLWVEENVSKSDRI